MDVCSVPECNIITKGSGEERLYAGMLRREWDNLIRCNGRKTWKKWSKLDFSRNFTPDDQRIPDPPEEAILEVLKIIGKDKSCRRDKLRSMRLSIMP